MGLDQRLFVTDYVGGWSFSTDPRYEDLVKLLGIEPTPESPFINIQVPVLYWRKAYAIQDFFERHIEPLENGQYHHISREALEELRDSCDHVIDNPEDAGEMFPGGGWMSGEHNEWFYTEIKRTYESLRKLLADPKFESVSFSYEADW